jgi:hypothetical protein
LFQFIKKINLVHHLSKKSNFIFLNQASIQIFSTTSKESYKNNKNPIKFEPKTTEFKRNKMKIKHEQKKKHY